MINAMDKSSILPWEEGLVLERAAPSCPGISIVIPIYNSGEFLEKTIRSLLCNDLTGCEIIVMDGGSTDNTLDILDYYKDFFSICISEKDEGQSDAINKGFALAKCPILYWLNGDDIILPNVLPRIRERFKDSNLQALVGNAYMTERNFEPIRHFVFSEEKLRFDYLLDYASNHLIQPSVFFTKKAWEKCGPLKKELHYAMDADLFIGMAKEFRLAHIDCDVAYSVYHEQCKTRGRRAESITELALVQASYGGIEQSRKTLNILVDIFNENSKRLESEATRDKCEKCDALAAQMGALRKEVQANIDLALSVEIEVQ